MKKLILSVCGLLSAAILSSTVQAATGEWWEISAKMEMEGMPFAMPVQISKVCMPKGGESDPRYTQGKDSDCKMTDVKQSGDTTKFKGTCVRKGETMNVVGETTHTANSFKSNLKMSGKSDGQVVNMAMTSTGKRIGGSCDTEAAGKRAEEMGKKIQAQGDAQIAATCDISKSKTTDLIAMSSFYFDAKPLCKGKKDAVCKIIRNDAARDTNVFASLKQHEESKASSSVVQACKLNMDSMRKSLCKANAKRGPLDFLDANCPAEAKAYRELARKQHACEGRGFTGVNYDANMKKCMSGEFVEDGAASRSYTGVEKSVSDDASSEAVRQGTKALKGLFGF